MNLDPRIGADFRELVSAFGLRSAWSARIKAIENEIAASVTRLVRHPQHSLQKELAAARFELAWLDHPTNPNNT
jgi:hypothetical protein